MNTTSAQAHIVKIPSKKWRVILWIIAVIAVIVIAYIGISVYAANRLSLPTRNFNPELNPGMYNLEYEEFTYPARSDGLEIAAWYIPSVDNDRVIILVHGRDNSRTNGFLDEFVTFAKDIHNAGFSVMMIDLRGHGQSADARFTFGVKERQDVLGAVDWLESRGYQPGKIGALGYSLGAGSVIGAAAEDADIGAIWVDSAYAESKSVLNQLGKFFGLPQFLINSSEGMIRLLYGYDITASRPIDEIASIAPRPIFMAHCQNDHLITIDNLEKLLTVAQNTTTWVISDCDQDAHGVKVVPEMYNNHAIGYEFNKEEYTSKVIDFFDENLK